MPPRRVVVVGAGISGLVTAYRLLQTSNGSPLDVVVVEASPDLGGKLRTGELAGVPIEEGADSFLVRKPWAIELCRELGLGDQLVAPAPGWAYVWARGRLVPYPSPAPFGIPASPGDLARWPGLSRRGRIRALGDLLKPSRRDQGDESIDQLGVRRLGREAARTLVGPLLAGIHAGHPARLGVAATFPELRRWERDHGSLIRGARAAAKAARERGGPEPLFATVWAGLSSLVDVLASALGHTRIWAGRPVVSIERSAGRWLVAVAGGEGIAADALVLAGPAFESGRLLSPVSPEASRELAAIQYVSTAVVTLVYEEGTAGRLPPGTGFIVPPLGGGPSSAAPSEPAAGRAPRSITACTWVSSKWPRDEHAGRAVVRCFVGRAGDESAVELPDDELVRKVAADVDAATPLGAPPRAARVTRWPRSMPQYEVGHLERLARLEAAISRLPGLFLTGSAYRGVGISDCVRQAGDTAERVRIYLASGAGAGPGPATVQQEAIT